MEKNLEKEVVPEEETFERYKYDIKKELIECAWKYIAKEADYEKQMPEEEKKNGGVTGMQKKEILMES